MLQFHQLTFLIFTLLLFRAALKENGHFWDFTQKADLVLVVENEEFHVHRSILTTCSPVFHVMLDSDFKEKNSSVIYLPDKSKEDIQLMLNFLYPFGYCITDETNVQSLLDLSREYQISKIRDMCESHLLRKIPTIDQFIVAQEYNLNLLQEKCLRQLSEKALNGLQDHPRYNELSDKNRLLLLEQQLKRLQIYCKKVSQIAHASDMRYLPIITHVHCGHRPKNCTNPHFICYICRASALRWFIKEETWKLGQDRNKTTLY